MDIAQISVIGGLVLSAIGLISTVLIKRYEFEAAIYKSVIECAYKEWEAKVNLIKYIQEKSGRRAKYVPFAEYLIYYNGFYRLLRKDKINEHEMEKFMKKYNQQIAALYKSNSKNTMM